MVPLTTEQKGQIAFLKVQQQLSASILCSITRASFIEPK